MYLNLRLHLVNVEMLNVTLSNLKVILCGFKTECY